MPIFWTYCLSLSGLKNGNMSKMIKGFSKLNKAEKIDWLAENFFFEKEKGIETLKQYFNKDAELQQLHDDFIENTISNSQTICNSINGQLKGLSIIDSGRTYTEP